ncbi:MAG: hypothetical protein IPL55_06955 [Saprospiraceae bacterium]|jgi:hypothetical protein|nr:hypothetical protein [Saprospiraceae bacterium]
MTFFFCNVLLAQDKKVYLTQGQIGAIMTTAKIKVEIKTDEQVIHDHLDEAIRNRIITKDSFSQELFSLPINGNGNKAVLLKNDQQILGEFLLEQEQLLTGNNNIWIVSGSIVIYKIKLKKQDIAQAYDNHHQFEPRSGFDYVLKKISDGTLGTKDYSAVKQQIEPLIEFEEAILRTVSKKGTGPTLEKAINTIISNITKDDIAYSSDN